MSGNHISYRVWLGITYVWVQHANLYLLAMTRTNLNAAAIVLFLHRLVDVFKEYFEELEEESLRDNFVIVYELLDEVKTPFFESNPSSFLQVMDFGYPQFTEGKILSEFIKTDAHRMEVQFCWFLRCIWNLCF